jgi:hypothetical protein
VQSRGVRRIEELSRGGRSDGYQHRVERREYRSAAHRSEEIRSAEQRREERVKKCSA